MHQGYFSFVLHVRGRSGGHMLRFNHLAAVADSGEVTSADKKFFSVVAHLDNRFPHIDYQVFASRERAP